MKNHNFNLQLLAYDPQEQPDSNTGASGLSAEMKTFYDMRLIDEASPMLVHEQFGQKRPIPKGQRKDCFFPPLFPSRQGYDRAYRRRYSERKLAQRT